MSDPQLQRTFRCVDCFDTGSRYEDGVYVPCECKRQARILEYLEKAEIPARYTDCTFQNFKPQTISQSQAMITAATFATDYPTERGLLLVGTVGTGKTHLATSALKNIIAGKSVAGFFIEFSELLIRIQQSWDSAAQTTQWSLLSRVRSSPILVLDEVGARTLTDWARDILYTIINGRYNRKQLTVFTTNYLDVPKIGDDSLEDRIGERLRSRLFEMCKTVQIDGPDYRRGVKKNG